MHKLLRDFELQIYHLILARRPKQEKVNNIYIYIYREREKLLNNGLSRSGQPKQNWKKAKTKVNIWNLWEDWKKKKKRNMKVSVIPIVTGALGTVTKALIKSVEDL